MRNLLVLMVLSSVLCIGCKRSTSVTFNQPGKAIVGLTGLIQLQPDSTIVNLEHYFLNHDIALMKVPQGLTANLEGKTLTLKGNPEGVIDYFSVKSGGMEYAFPVRRSRRIAYTFSFKANKEYPDLRIKGSFNNWNLDANPLEFKDGVYSFTDYFNPGKYEYVFVSEGQEFPDPTNPKSVGNGMGGANSILTIGNIEEKTPFIYTSKLTSNPDTRQHLIDIEANNVNLPLVLFNNHLLPDGFVFQTQPGKFRITLPFSKSEDRNFLRIYASNEQSAANDILIPLKGTEPILHPDELTRTDKQRMVMYSILVDRFNNGSKANDAPLNTPEVFPANDYKGGDLQGVAQRVEDGYFKKLNVNTLWVSPIVDNPENPYGYLDQWGVKTKFSGYHGYWPISSSMIEKRFGDETVFKNLIQKTHENDMNILLDYVANHVHEEHPVIQQHPDWKTNLWLPDGRENTRLWDEQRLTTWFDTFMPTLDLENPEVAEAMSDSAVWWFKNYDIDGFRHDATKHIPKSFWSLLTKKLKEDVIVPNGRPLYQIGETYGGNDLIASYVNPGMLDAQFDFNLSSKAMHAFFRPDNGFDNLIDALNQSLYYYGYHHVMGNISGNHDNARLISYADGSVSFDEDSKEAGYTRNIQNKDNEGWDKAFQLMAFNAFVPGVPVIYYGDEIGMPGGNDPDCRRMMIFDDWNQNQQELFNKVSKMNGLRLSRMELLYGDIQLLNNYQNKVLVLARTYLGQSSILLLNKSNEAVSISIELPEYFKEKEIQNLLEEGSAFKKNGHTLVLEISANGVVALGTK